MSGSNSEARKRAGEKPPPEPTWPALQLVEDVRIAAGEVWPGVERVDAEALMDQLETRGLKVVRA